MGDQPCLVRDLITTLHQGMELVSGVSACVYARGVPELGASSVGAHYRHHLEHVQLLLTGCASGVVDYDRRARELRLETDRAYALERTAELMAQLEGLDAAALARPLQVVHRSCVSDDEGDRPTCASTLERELLFVLSHAVHHYALMNVVAQLLGQQTDRTIGIMPSTLVYQAGAAKG